MVLFLVVRYLLSMEIHVISDAMMDSGPVKDWSLLPKFVRMMAHLMDKIFNVMVMIFLKTMLDFNLSFLFIAARICMDIKIREKNILVLYLLNYGLIHFRATFHIEARWSSKKEDNQKVIRMVKINHGNIVDAWGGVRVGVKKALPISGEVHCWHFVYIQCICYYSPGKMSSVECP